MSWPHCPLPPATIPLEESRCGSGERPLRGEFTSRDASVSLYRRGLVDHFHTWARSAPAPEAGQDVTVELRIGAGLVKRARRARSRCGGAPAGSSGGWSARVSRVGSPRPRQPHGEYPDRRFATRYDRELGVSVDASERASAPVRDVSRSASPSQAGTGPLPTSSSAPYVAEMGFHVLYLPPVHPSAVLPQGRNNTVTHRR